jgi:hypothetical protein
VIAVRGTLGALVLIGCLGLSACGGDGETGAPSTVEPSANIGEDLMKPSEVLTSGQGTALILVTVDEGAVRVCLSDAIGDSRPPKCGAPAGAAENPELAPSEVVDDLVSQMPDGGYAKMSLEMVDDQWQITDFTVTEAF